MVQPGQDWNGNYLGSCLCSGTIGFRGVVDLLPNALMGSYMVEVGHIGIEHALELPLMQDQQVVQAFLPHTPQEAFADHISPSRGRGSFSVSTGLYLNG
jgi:hypothetical protein